MREMCEGGTVRFYLDDLPMFIEIECQHFACLS
ncbi:hypothetical protein Hneap_1849 [Halothiobacillus neapolitanus c2]|uniref:Uncharacterized protein n=1 Tax=Halothiobacillus neapolitanus (strain ATCC 23641 / DSM 15147 / CIP 104769 / NCIMB 8539 / c2) TaxID=555778 RepID=D0L1U8_HALNC|nr:hypothetical protein Hneap_1849 [Halothiobacillus neapolitanus c2]